MSETMSFVFFLFQNSSFIFNIINDFVGYSISTGQWDIQYPVFWPPVQKGSVKHSSFCSFCCFSMQRSFLIYLFSFTSEQCLFSFELDLYRSVRNTGNIFLSFIRKYDECMRHPYLNLIKIVEQIVLDNELTKTFSLLSETPGSFGNISVVLEDFLPSASNIYLWTGAFSYVAHMTLAAPGRCL